MGWLSTIKESQKVTRQDSTPRTCAEMSLVEKLCGRGLQALLFKALFHCSQRFPAGLGHKCDPPPTLTRLHFKKQQQKKTWDIFLNLSTKMSFSCNQSLDGSFPPSPAEDRRSNRLSWGSLLQKLSELKGNNQRATADHLSSRSQTGEFLLE